MSRFMALMASDPARLRCVLHPGRKQLVVPAADSDGWGIGFYQSGEVLLQRRPMRPISQVDFYAASSDLRTDVLVGHVRRATAGMLKNENTPPFRFRSWLWAHDGAIADFPAVQERLSQSIPDFLRRNIRGQTDSEHLFHLFLSFLHDTGRIDDPMLAPRQAAEALGRTVAAVGKLSPDRPSEMDVVVTNGRILLGLRAGAPLHYYRVEGVRDCPVCRETADFTGREPKRVDHDHLRALVLVANAETPLGPPWEELADRHIVAAQHDHTVEILPLVS